VPPTIYDIAERADVSTATVSRVFNDESGVATETRQRVLEAAQALDYRPHASARNLARQKTNIIAVVVPVLAQYFYMGVLRGIQDSLANSDFDLLVYSPSRPGEIENPLRRATKRGRSDGLLFLSREVTPGIVEHLRATDQEVVLVDTEHPEFESIAIKNEEGGYIATRHLIDEGHERIAHITSEEPEPPPAEQRRKGYERALSDAGQEPILARGAGEPFAFSKEGGYRAMTSLLDRDSMPDAVFASSDMQAVGARKAIRETGLRIPQDVALVGFDDIDLSAYVGLTTVRQPLLDFGKFAIEKLLGRMDDPGRNVSSTVFAPELVVRSSCGHEPTDKIE
jgi:LacI family transcriptional regulator